MRLARRIRRLSRAAFSLLVAISVLVSVVLAGQRYFFCPPMSEASFDSCCTRAAQDSEDAAPRHDEGPTIDRESCCKTAHLATPAPGTYAPRPLALDAPFVGVLPAPSPIATPHALAPIARERLARAGPGDPTPRDHRLRVMVFLT